MNSLEAVVSLWIIFTVLLIVAFVWFLFPAAVEQEEKHPEDSFFGNADMSFADTEPMEHHK